MPPAIPAGLTWGQVRRRRLWRHSLLERAPVERLAEVVGDACGIHAQLITAAELSVGVITSFCGAPFFIYLLRSRAGRVMP